MWCARERILLCSNDVRLCAIVCNRAPLEQAERVAAVRRVAELREVDDGASRVGRRHGSSRVGLHAACRSRGLSLNFARMSTRVVDRQSRPESARAHAEVDGKMFVSPTL